MLRGVVWPAARRPLLWPALAKLWRGRVVRPSYERERGLSSFRPHKDILIPTALPTKPDDLLFLLRQTDIRAIFHFRMGIWRGGSRDSSTPDGQLQYFEFFIIILLSVTIL